MIRLEKHPKNIAYDQNVPPHVSYVLEAALWHVHM